MTTQSNIDLNTCVPGQKVRLRYGFIAEYVKPMKKGICGDYKHLVKDAYQLNTELNTESYTDDGCFWSDKRKSELDIVEILPLESDMDIDLNTCVPGQKVKLRDGTIATYEGIVDGNRRYIHSVGYHSYTNRGTYWDKPNDTNTKDVVEILPIEEEESTKATPELTHSITDQIDVTNPDHVSIIPHEHGVTISIKKGLTTISWRHCNS
jgi:hypothetical protein